MRPDPLIRAEDVAEHLTVSTDWVYRKARMGRIPSRRLDGLLRFSLEEVMAALETRPVQAATSTSAEPTSFTAAWDTLRGGQTASRNKKKTGSRG